MAAMSFSAWRGPEDLRKHGSPFPIDDRQVSQPTQVRDALRTLNKLAGSKFNASSQLPCRPLTKVQTHVVECLHQGLRDVGPRPEGLTGSEALSQMARSSASYDEMPNNLADYDFEKVKILKSQVRPKDLKTLLPPSLRPFISNFKDHVVRDRARVQAELEQNPDAMPRMPYWDPTLRSDETERMRLLRQMFDIGLVDLQPTVCARAGIFFVKKKDPKFIRLIIDGRQANFNHRRPPVTRLGSAACMAELRLPGGPRGFARELDVSDCFYQFRIDEAAAWFGLDDPRRVEEWRDIGLEVTSVFDYRLGIRRSVQQGEILYPVVSAMSMGWSWALFLANETIAAIVRASAPSPHAELRERLPTPQLDDWETVTSTYVDNVTVIGLDFKCVQVRCDALDSAFKELDIPVVWSQDQPVQRLDTIGCDLDLAAATLRNKAHRVWKVHLAGHELARRGRVRIETVEVWLGHATSLFRLRPCLLSIFDKIYRFTELGRGRRWPLWPSVRSEIRMASDLVWVTHVSLNAPIISQVDAGDSADHGYAMMTRALPDYEIRRMIRYKEKWRYVGLPGDIKEALDGADWETLKTLLHQRTGVLPELAEGGAEHVRSGLGIDTEYGQWLQQVISEGDWLKTSAVASQRRARPKQRVDVDLPSLVVPVRHEVLNPDKFKLLWAKRWKNPASHINIKEALVALSSLKRSARVASLQGHLKLTLSDNLPAVLAFDKGRSSSPGLNRLCRLAACFQVGLGIQWRLRHVESPRNVADGPSRWFEQSRPPEVKWIEMPMVHRVPVLQLAKRLGCGNAFEVRGRHSHGPPGLQAQERSLSTQFERPVQKREFSTQSQAWSPPPAPSSSTSSMRLTEPCRRIAMPSGVVLEVFSGSQRLSSACKQEGLFVLASLDIKQGDICDLTMQRTQAALREVIQRGHVHYVHFGTPSVVFSGARKGIRNSEAARAKERIGVELAFLTCKLVELCRKHSVLWSVENPRGSMLWELLPIQWLKHDPSTFEIDFPMCAFGAPYQRWTRLLTNAVELSALSRSCPHVRHKQVLSGATSTRAEHVNRTELAGAYPHSLVDTWASLLRKTLGPCRHEEECLAARRELLHQLRYTKADRQGQAFFLTDQIYTRVPRFKATILFGQDSAAARARKRHIRRGICEKFRWSWGET